VHQNEDSNEHAHLNEWLDCEPECWVYSKESKRWEEKPQWRSCLTENFLERNLHGALKLQWSLMCWREHHDLTGFHLAPVSTRKRQSVQFDRKSIWGLAKTIEESLEHEVTKSTEKKAQKEKTKKAADKIHKNKACKLLLEKDNCKIDSLQTPKQTYSALG
jgi:hypothetical protein